jgi:tetratricopeptide (TPR) repeat protein
MFKGELGRSDSCFAELERSTIPVLQSSARTCRCLLTAYKGQFRAALSQLDTALRIDSAEGKALSIADKLCLKAQILEATNRLPEALATVESNSYQGAFDFHDATRRLAYRIRLLGMTGHLDEAATIPTRIKIGIDSAASLPGPYFSARAALFISQSRTDSAINYLERSVAEADDFYDQVQLGKLYLENERLGEAVAILEKAASTYSSRRMLWCIESVQIHYYLAKAYEASKWYPQAIAQYRTFLSVWVAGDPDIEAIRDARSRLAALEHRS